MRVLMLAVVSMMLTSWLYQYTNSTMSIATSSSSSIVVTTTTSTITTPDALNIMQDDDDANNSGNATKAKEFLALPSLHPSNQPSMNNATLVHDVGRSNNLNSSITIETNDDHARNHSRTRNADLENGGSMMNMTNLLLDLNNNSTIAADIINITHVKNESKIIIHLKNQRHCQQPQLVGRLSGPALSKVTWEEQVHEEDHNEGAFVVGHYHVPLLGRYFIEIIVTMCNKLGHDTDIKPICLEDSTRHRLTHKNASIDVMPLRDTINTPRNPALIQSIEKSGVIGYWYNKNTLETMYKPLHTRYQPMGCRKLRDVRSSHCQEAINLSRFDPYEFQFATNFSLVERLEGKEGKVCFEGASHSRILFNRASNLLSTAPFNATIKNVEIVGTYHSQYTKFVHQFTHEKIQAIIAKNCTKVIVGTGQWDAYRPTLFPAYEKALETAMSMMGDMFRNANVDLFFRTTQ